MRSFGWAFPSGDEDAHGRFIACAWFRRVNEADGEDLRCLLAELIHHVRAGAAKRLVVQFEHRLAPPPAPKPLHTYKSFSPKKERRQVVRVLSKPSSTEAPFVCDPRRPPLWPRTLTLAAAAAAPPHVPVGVARRARTPSAPCLATENRALQGRDFGAGTNFDCGFWSGKPCRKCVSRGRGKNHSSP